MNAKLWKQTIKALPPRMTQVEAAAYLNRSTGSVRYWIKRLKYRFADGRMKCWPESRRQERRTINAASVDWSKPNVQIAAENGVTRECVRQLRKALNLPKVNGRKICACRSKNINP